MYAIIRTGGKQYRVQEGDVIDVELLSQESSAEFREVLLINDGKTIRIGLPCLEKCFVLGEVVEEIAGPKVIAYKYRKRKNSQRKIGHRQKYSRVKITKIHSENAE